MPRPKNAREFLEGIDMINSRYKRGFISDSLSNECTECSEPYLSVYSAITEGYCACCALDKFYGSTKEALEDLSEMQRAREERTARDARAFQRNLAQKQFSVPNQNA